jgi:hypothetical protein
MRGAAGYLARARGNDGGREERASAPSDFDAPALAWQPNRLWQGSMLVARTKREPGLVVRSLAPRANRSMCSSPTTTIVPSAVKRPA